MSRGAAWKSEPGDEQYCYGEYLAHDCESLKVYHPALPPDRLNLGHLEREAEAGTLVAPAARCDASNASNIRPTNATLEKLDAALSLLFDSLAARNSRASSTAPPRSGASGRGFPARGRSVRGRMARLGTHAVRSAARHRLDRISRRPFPAECGLCPAGLRQPHEAGGLDPSAAVPPNPARHFPGREWDPHHRRRIRRADRQIVHRLGTDPAPRALPPMAVLGARLLRGRGAARPGPWRLDRAMDAGLRLPLRLRPGAAGRPPSGQRARPGP